MRFLVLLTLIESGLSVPPLIRDPPVSSTNNVPPAALELLQDRFGKHALFIPRDQLREGFDPLRPIQGAFFVSSDTEPFNQVPFKTPQTTSIITNRARLPLPQSAVPPARVDVSETPVASASFTAPHVVPLEIAPDSEQEPREMPGQEFTLRSPTVEQLVTTTQNAPTLSVIEQNTG
ncbi:hypothetical protein OSTOST_01038, partial [Ostertagia ostertagi]